jgi:hypothetical protein
MLDQPRLVPSKYATLIERSDHIHLNKRQMTTATKTATLQAKTNLSTEIFIEQYLALGS